MKESVNCGEDPKVPSVKIEFEIMAGCAELSHSVVSDSVTPWAVALQARILQWVAMPSLKGIFPTQKSNQGLLHCRQILYQLSYQGSPNG